MGILDPNVAYFDTAGPQQASATPQEAPQGVAGYAGDMLKGANEGTAKAMNETVDFIYELNNAINPFARALPEGQKPTPPGWSKPWNMQALKPASLPGHITSGLAQFAAGFIGAGKVTKAVTAGREIGGVSSTLLHIGQGALADAVATDPFEGRLSDLLKDVPALGAIVPDYLLSKEGDTALEGRLKNVLEGAMAGAAVDGAVQMFKAYKAYRLARASGDPKTIQKTMVDTADHMEQFLQEESVRLQNEHSAATTVESLDQASKVVADMPAVKEAAAEAAAKAASPPPSFVKQPDIIPTTGSTKTAGQNFASQTLDHLYGEGYAESLRGPARASVEGTAYQARPAVTGAFEDPAIIEQGMKAAKDKAALEAAQASPQPGKLPGQVAPDRIPTTGDVTTAEAAAKATDDASLDAALAADKAARSPYNMVGQRGFNGVLGGTSGMEQDEQGNITFDPLKATVGGVLGAVAYSLYNRRKQAKAGGGEASRSGESVVVGAKAEATDTKAGVKAVDKVVDPATALSLEQRRSLSRFNEKNLDELADAANAYGNLDAAPKARLFNDDTWTSPEVIKESAKAAGARVLGRIDNEVKKQAMTARAATDLAEMIGEHPERMIAKGEKMLGSLKDLDEWVVGTKIALQSMAKTVDELATVVSRGATPQDEAKFLLAFTRYESLVATSKNMQKWAARATSAGRIRTYDAIDMTGIGELGEVLNAMGGSEKIREFASKIALAGGNPQALTDAVQPGAWNRILDRHNEYWFNSVLSGPTTHFVNMVGNLTKALVVPAEKMLGGVFTGDRNAIKEGQLLYSGLWSFKSDAWKMAKQAWHDDRSILDPGHMVQEGRTSAWSPESFGLKSDSTLYNFTDFVSKAINLPGRALLSSDEFFKQLNYRAKVYSEATTEGIQAGKGGRDLAEHITQRLTAAADEFGAGVESKALDFAQRTTWTQDLKYGIGKDLQRFANAHPMLKPIIPFIRTPTNLFRDFEQHIPVLGGFQHDMREAFRNRAADPEAWTDFIGKQAMGAAFWGTALMAVQQGVITGGGPADPRERKVWLENNKPYSLRVGDTLVNYGRFDPYGMIFGLAADMHNLLQLTTSEDAASRVAFAASAAIARNLSSKTYIKGLIDLANLFTNGEGYAESFVYSKEGSYIPNGLRQLTQLVDPGLKEVRSMVDVLMAGTPGLSSKLPKSYSWLTGEPVVPSYFTAPAKDNPVVNEMIKLDHGFEALPKELTKGLPLSGEQYSRWAQLHGNMQIDGKNLMQTLAEAMASPDYDIRRQEFPDAPRGLDSPRTKMVKGTIGMFRHESMMQLMEEYPALAVLQQASKDKKVGYRAGDPSLIPPK